MKERLYTFVTTNGSTLGTVALILAALLVLSGCHTVAGMGTDITRSAEWSRDKMSGTKSN